MPPHVARLCHQVVCARQDTEAPVSTRPSIATQLRGVTMASDDSCLSLKTLTHRRRPSLWLEEEVAVHAVPEGQLPVPLVVEQITAKYHKNLSFLETSTKIGTHTP